MNKEKFYLALEQLGIVVNEIQKNQLEQFYELLLEWNEKINLTTILKEEEVYLKHFYDGATLFKVYDLTKDIRLCDVGSGAGFPGIVLKILFPNLKITLIDSLRKRVYYLQDVIEKLGLDNIEAIHVRMEDYSKVHREKFDVITARAVANMNFLTEISVASLKVDGILLFMKSSYLEELEKCNKLFSTLSLNVEKVEVFKLPVEESERSLICIRKTKKTDLKYPRTLDKIKKNPL